MCLSNKVLTFSLEISYECDDYVMNETASKRLLRALEQIQNNQDTNEMTSKRKKMSNESALSSVSVQCVCLSENLLSQ